MRQLLQSVIGFATLAAASAMPASAGVLYSETVSGDLSNVVATPTAIGSTTLGDNAITGSLVNEFDEFSFTVPAGQQLVSFSVTDFVGTGLPNFFLTLPPAVTGDLVGQVSSLGSASLNTDLFDRADFFAAGYSKPLPAGTYIVDFRGNGQTVTSYGFNLRTVPEPSSLALIAGAGLLAVRRRRRA